MPTNRITYGQTAIAVSQPPANSDNTHTVSGLKRIQGATLDFALARERFKQIGNDGFVGQVQTRNADIGLSVDYLYSNGTNEAIMGLNVDGNSKTALKYIKKENQDRNYYILLGTGDNDTPNTTEIFKNKFNVMALGNVFLDSYSLSASVGSIVSVSASLSAYNIVMNEYNNATNDGETIPAINTTKVGPGEPVLNKKYVLSTGTFQNTSNRDGNIPTAFGAGDIKMTLATVEEPGIEFTGTNPVYSAMIDSLDVGFSIERTDLYGLGSMYPYGRRAILPILGNLTFSALATEFTSGNLNTFISGSNYYNFTFDLTDRLCSGTTGLRLEVENAQLDGQGLANTIGDNASITASFGFSMSEESGLKISTPPLIVRQPATTASAGATLAVTVTGRTSSDGAKYGTDGFTYQWYTSDDYSVGPTATGSTFATDGTTGAATYYVIASNELGETKSNNAVVS